MHQRMGDLFPRAEVRERSLGYLEGLLSHCERKNSWQLAEWAGEASPYGMQYLLVRHGLAHLLHRSDWRRRQQCLAQLFHYRRQNSLLLAT